MKGLRHAGGTQLTRCCGAEAIVPSDTDEDKYVLETREGGTPITTDEFPDAELVCASCGRTFPDGCNHENITIRKAQNWASGDTPTIEAQAVCHECDEKIWLSLKLTDARVVGDDWDLSDHINEKELTVKDNA